MSDFNYYLRGMEELKKKFDGLNQKNIESLLAIALDKASAIVETQMKENAPVDTGNLRDSVDTSKLGTLKSIIGPDLKKASYAGFVESGHYTRGRKSFVPGQFYIARTAIEVAPRVTKLFKIDVVNAFQRK